MRVIRSKNPTHVKNSESVIRSKNPTHNKSSECVSNITTPLYFLSFFLIYFL